MPFAAHAPPAAFLRSFTSTLLLVALVCWPGFSRQVSAAERSEYIADFSRGLDGWHATDGSVWESRKLDDDSYVAAVKGMSAAYRPVHRSPHSILLKKDLVVGSFTLTAKVKTTQTSQAHRDLCVFFGWQDPEHFYYVHTAEQTDPHANQIFVVDNRPRAAITENQDRGTEWGADEWHAIKLVRDVRSGRIEVYFDDMHEPRKVATDRRFTWGAVGIGTFDDHGFFKDVVIKGETVDKTPLLPPSAK